MNWRIVRNAAIFGPLAAGLVAVGVLNSGGRGPGGDGRSADGNGADPGAQAAAPDRGSVPGWREFSRPFVEATELAAPSVVHIEVEQDIALGGRGRNNALDLFDGDFLRRFFSSGSGAGRTPPEELIKRGLGSGVIVDSTGHVLTNYHVVGEADRIRVVLADGRAFPGKVVGADEHSDLAVVRIAGSSLPVARLGDSDKLRAGEWVLAIGDPFGLDHTVTVGVVSARHRTHVENIPNEDFIQTDAAINPGNSGGPLVNLDGEVVGINSAIFTRSGGYMGIGFAISMNMARTIMTELIEHGKVRRAWLGVGAEDVTAAAARKLDLSRVSGALVASVVKGSPAAEAGVRENDVIVGLDGRPIETAGELANVVAFAPVGRELALKVIRDGRRRTLRVTLRKLSAGIESEQAGFLLADKIGLRVEDLTPALRGRLDLSPSAAGVVVSEVLQGSPAGRAGLEPGMLIEEVDGKPVADVPEFRKALGFSQDSARLKLRYRGETTRVSIQLGGA